jgi:hypothetical protein
MRFDMSKSLMDWRGFIKTPTRRIGEVSWNPRRREVRLKAELRRKAAPTFDFFSSLTPPTGELNGSESRRTLTDSSPLSPLQPENRMVRKVEEPLRILLLSHPSNRRTEWFEKSKNPYGFFSSLTPPSAGFENNKIHK